MQVVTDTSTQETLLVTNDSNSINVKSLRNRFRQTTCLDLKELPNGSVLNIFSITDYLVLSTLNGLIWVSTASWQPTPAPHSDLNLTQTEEIILVA